MQSIVAVLSLVAFVKGDCLEKEVRWQGFGLCCVQGRTVASSHIINCAEGNDSYTTEDIEHTPRQFGQTSHVRHRALTGTYGYHRRRQRRQTGRHAMIRKLDAKLYNATRGRGRTSLRNVTARPGIAGV